MRGISINFVEGFPIFLVRKRRSKFEQHKAIPGAAMRVPKGRASYLERNSRKCEFLEGHRRLVQEQFCAF